MDYVTNTLLKFRMCVLNAGGLRNISCFLCARINGGYGWVVLILQKEIVERALNTHPNLGRNFDHWIVTEFLVTLFHRWKYHYIMLRYGKNGDPIWRAL